MEEERYTGRPLAKLLDAWVLDAIGHLDEGTAGQLETLAPRIAAAVGIDPGASVDWRAIVTTALRMPPTAAHATRMLWSELEERAILDGAPPPDALSFASALADSRLAAVAR